MFTCRSESSNICLVVLDTDYNDICVGVCEVLVTDMAIQSRCLHTGSKHLTGRHNSVWGEASRYDMTRANRAVRGYCAMNMTTVYGAVHDQYSSSCPGQQGSEAAAQLSIQPHSHPSQYNQITFRRRSFWSDEILQSSNIDWLSYFFEKIFFVWFDANDALPFFGFFKFLIIKMG